MKTKLHIPIFTLLSFTLIMGCSAGRHVSAQPPYNNDGYNNPPPDDYSNNQYDQNRYDQNQYGDNQYNGQPNVDINVFVNELSPYGRWINTPSYGKVWISNERDFTPYYSGGHWVYSSYGWTWASDYRWGWAPFHYGRWAFDNFNGWMWVPGYEWGPAWVGWRSGGDYYGWAPLAPGIQINIGFGFGNYMPADRWCFVPRRNITSPYLGNYRVNRDRNITIINHTTIINTTNIYNNNRYIVGPDRREAERATGRRINEVRISNDSKPGNYRMVDNNTIKMYRPEPRKDNNGVRDQASNQRDRQAVDDRNKQLNDQRDRQQNEERQKQMNDQRNKQLNDQKDKQRHINDQRSRNQSPVNNQPANRPERNVQQQQTEQVTQPQSAPQPQTRQTSKKRGPGK